MLPAGHGSKPMVPFWGRCTTHFRTYFSGDWDVHWAQGFDPQPARSRHEKEKARRARLPKTGAPSALHPLLLQVQQARQRAAQKANALRSFGVVVSDQFAVTPRPFFVFVCFFGVGAGELGGEKLFFFGGGTNRCFSFWGGGTNRLLKEKWFEDV